jgi:PAS domain S-box-containing protein
MNRVIARAARRPHTLEAPPTGESLADFLEALPVPAAVLDADRTTLAWNRAAERAYGWSAAEVVGARLPLAGEAASSELRLLVSGALHGQSPLRLELDGVNRCGERVVVRMSAAALPAPDAAPRVLLTLEDVTERGTLRRRLARARRNERRLAELSPEPMLILREGVVAYANPACGRMLGAPRRTLVGMELNALTVSENDEIRQLAARRATRNMGAVLELRLRRLDGEVIDADVVATPLLFRRRPALLLVLRDAAPRRVMEAELERSQERFRLLTETLRDHAVVALDAAGRIISWNAGAEQLFGYTATQAIGQDSALLFREEDVAAGRPAAELRATRDLGRFEAEEWRCRADGTAFWAVVTVAPQYAAEDRLVGFAATVRDVSDRREAQEALRQMEEQLRHSQRMEAIGRLAAGVAHDFNNVLTAVRGYGQLLVDELGDDPRAADAEEIRRAAERGAALTRQLLTLARRQPLKLRPIDLNAVVGEAEKMLRRIVGDGIALEVRLDPELGTVRADAAHIEQVLMNLVVNARDAMPDGGRLTLATRNRAEADGTATVVLSVSDTGTGIDAETRGRIFEPFFTTKPAGQGSGLGLSTAYGIVKQSEGSIEVQTEVGMGTTFEVALPRIDESGAEAATPAAAEPALVLVAMQDRLLRALVRRTLERRGYALLEADSAAAAFRVARGAPRPIDLLVADSAMRGPGGLALAEALAGACNAARVLYITETSEPASSRPLAGPEAAILTKPFTPLVLARRVRTLLGRAVAT